MKNKIIIIMCPPLKTYAEPPADQPGCLKDKCPHCAEEIWISTRKRVIRDCNSPNTVMIFCYDCMKKKIKSNPELFANHVMMQL